MSERSATHYTDLLQLWRDRRTYEDPILTAEDLSQLSIEEGSIRMVVLDELVKFFMAISGRPDLFKELKSLDSMAWEDWPVEWVDGKADTWPKYPVE